MESALCSNGNKALLKITVDKTDPVAQKKLELHHQLWIVSNSNH